MGKRSFALVGGDSLGWLSPFASVRQQQLFVKVAGEMQGKRLRDLLPERIEAPRQHLVIRVMAHPLPVLVLARASCQASMQPSLSIGFGCLKR